MSRREGFCDFLWIKHQNLVKKEKEKSCLKSSEKLKTAKSLLLYFNQGIKHKKGLGLCFLAMKSET